MRCLFVKLFHGKGTTDELSERFQTAVDPYPRPSEWFLSLEIICMHLILSGPHTYFHKCNHIH